MIADGEDLDQFEAAYEALAARKTTKAELENNNTITLNMGNKEDKDKRDMLTHKENEVQDNIKVITENRSQFKIIGYQGFAHDTMNKYQQETNDYLAKHGGTSIPTESQGSNTTRPAHPPETWKSTSPR